MNHSYFSLLLVAGLFFSNDCLTKDYQFTLKVKYIASRIEDSLYLTFENAYQIHEGRSRFVSAPLSRDGYYHFKVSTSLQQGIMMIGKLKSFRQQENWSANKYIHITPWLFWEQGDDIIITVTKKTPADHEGNLYVDNTFRYSGKSSAKYQGLAKADSAFRKRASLSGHDQFYPGYAFMDKFYFNKKTAKRMLDKYRESLSDYAYYSMLARLYYLSSGEEFYYLQDYFEKKVNPCPDSMEYFLTTAFGKLDRLLEDTGIPESYAENSFSYILMRFRRIRAELMLRYPEDQLQEHIFNYLLTLPRSRIRDRLFIMLFAEVNPGMQDERLYSEALGLFCDKAILDELTSMRKSSPGSPAPAFTLMNDKEEIVPLSDFKGKTVVLDFWSTGCGACAYLNEHVMEYLYKRFGSDTTVVFANITADRSKQAWLKSIQSGKYTHEGSVNLFTFGQGFSHPVFLDYNINGFPTVVIIDGRQKVVAVYKGLTPSLDMDAMRRELEGIIASTQAKR